MNVDYNRSGENPEDIINLEDSGKIEDYYNIGEGYYPEGYDNGQSTTSIDSKVEKELEQMVHIQKVTQGEDFVNRLRNNPIMQSIDSKIIDFLNKYGICLSFGIGIPLPEGYGDLGVWSDTASDAGLANKLHHIFDNPEPEHDFGPLLSQFGGNQLETFRALEVATKESVMESGIIDFTEEGITVNVEGVNVTITGKVEGGVVKIGTATIPK